MPGYRCRDIDPDKYPCINEKTCMNKIAAKIDNTNDECKNGVLNEIAVILRSEFLDVGCIKLAIIEMTCGHKNLFIWKKVLYANMMYLPCPPFSHDQPHHVVCCSAVNPGGLGGAYQFRSRFNGRMLGTSSTFFS